MRIALVCSGVGRVQRGFERFFTGLFETVRDDVDITLFKGGGPSDDRERVVRSLYRHSGVHRVLPLGRLSGKSPLIWENVTFALALWPHLRRGRYDVVHFIDIYVGLVLDRLRRWRRSPVRLLYSQGVVVDPAHYPPADHVHQVSAALLDEALAHGHAGDRMTLIPCGMHADRFSTPPDRAAMRRKYGVPEDRFVVLSVGAVNRVQKRFDHVIAEIASLGDDSLLWVDGHPEDPEVADLGRERLGDRFRISRVESHQVVELYALADVFVLGSLHESFGLVVVEAMCAGLPVLVHDSTHFRWLVDEADALVDMEAPGALATAVRRLRDDPARRRRLGTALAEAGPRRFDWGALRDDYLALYARMGSAQLPAAAR